MSQEKLDVLGTWELVSFELRLSNGDISYPFGKNAKGMLIYTQDGYMSGKLMSSERSNFLVSDPLKGTSEEIKEAFEQFIGYYGRYEVDFTNKVMKHYIKGSFFPNWEGQTQERFFELSADILTLSTPPLTYGEDNAVGVLIWKRV